MARKKMNYTRNKNKTRPWYKKKYNALQLAGKAWNGIKYLKGLVNSELYKYDVNSNFDPTTAGAVTNCFAIAQGDGVSARTGNSLFVRSINIQYTIAWNPSATGVGQCVVSWLILDTQQTSDETTLTFTDIFNNMNVNSQLNASTVGRYKLLRKTKHYVSSDKPKVQFNIYKRLRHHVRYNGTGSGDLQKGAIFWVVCSDTTVNNPTVVYSMRVSYHDN